MKTKAFRLSMYDEIRMRWIVPLYLRTDLLGVYVGNEDEGVLVVDVRRDPDAMDRPTSSLNGRSRRLGWWWRRRRSGCRRTMRSGRQGSSPSSPNGRYRRLGWWWRRRRSGCRRTMRSGRDGSARAISERTFSAFRLVMKTTAFRLSTYDEIRMPCIGPFISERDVLGV